MAAQHRNDTTDVVISLAALTSTRTVFEINLHSKAVICLPAFNRRWPSENRSCKEPDVGPRWPPRGIIQAYS